MITIRTLDDINRLIYERVTENQSLEYKAADSLSRSEKKELSKDVSGMANSEGGTIIYGIAETGRNTHIPDKIDPVNGDLFSKEWLEQSILSNISPVISGITIVPITISEGKFVFVVNVPKGDTAYQNTVDHKYYRRRNFKVEPMLDFEIREVMNRVKHPQFVVDFLLQLDYENGAGLRYKLLSSATNIGNIYAKHINYSFEVPNSILPDGWSHPEETRIFKQTNLYNNLLYIPILPGLKGSVKTVEVIKNWTADSDLRIKWRIYADSAPYKLGETLIKDIPIVNIY